MPSKSTKRPSETIDLTSDDNNAASPQRPAKQARTSPSYSHRPSNPLPTPESSQNLNSSQRDREDWVLDADAEIVHGGEYETHESMVLYGHLPGKIVGVQYYKGHANDGERVLLRREPRNPYDTNAIRVDSCGFTQIGHIPRALAAKLSPFIDSGKLLVEASLAGQKSFYHVPLTLSLYGTDEPVASATLKREMQEQKLPVVELARLEKERKQAEKEKAKRAQAARKKELAQIIKDAGGVKKGDGSAQLDIDGSGEWKNITIQSDDLSDLTMEQILEKTVTFDPRELDQVVSKCGAGEETLSKLPKANQPQALATKLLPYQLQGLAWMQDRESPQLPEPGSKDTVQLWRREGKGFLNIATQYFSDKPSLGSGGILADDMGLGKTIQVISLIVADPDLGKSPTLILAPLSVMSNWSGQINAHVKSDNALKILTYHGANAKGHSSSNLQGYDVVITTYDTLAQEYMPGGARSKPEAVPRKSGLFSVNWRRVVQDEGHITRNPKTKKAQAVHALAAQSRWVLTGTPIVNTLRDLYSHIKFLRLTGGLESIEIFTGTLIRPLSQGGSEANLLLQALISTICLRRMKDMKFIDLRLPKLSSHLCPIQWLPHEKEKYEAFEQEAKGLLLQYQTRRRTKGDNTYSHLLEVLLRLRQTCNHWSLCRDRVQGLMAIINEGKVELNSKTKRALQDLLQISIENQEDCPVCLETLHNPVITNCKHCFGSECIERVIETQQKCPMCRQALTQHDLVQPALNLGESRGDEVEAETSSSKIKAMMDILKASRKKEGAKTVVFSQWTSFLDLVGHELQRQGLVYCRLDGTMKAAERDEAIEQLDYNPDCTIMLASLSVCSVGLNLVSANQVIMCDTWWSPAIEDQAVDRVHRLGQTRPVAVFRLVMEDSIEERVIGIQQNKRKLMMTAFQEKTMKRGKETSARLAEIEKLLLA